MIPVSSRDSFTLYRPVYREVWVPTMIAVRRPCQPLPSPPEQRAAFTSADEICAANVLLNLTHKEKSHEFASARTHAGSYHGTVPQYPRVESTVPRFRAIHTPEQTPSHTSPSRMWAPITTSGISALQASTPPSQVSDHSGGENSTTDDESSCADESFSNASTGPPLSPENESNSGNWFQGCVSLALPEDTDVLSPLHCFMRRYCVEVFSATPEDVSTPRYGKSHGVKVVAGQVGIRCMYCKHRPAGKRPERAVCYPSSLRNIYHSIETWQRRHSLVCSDIPGWVRRSIVELMESSKSRAGGRRQYWEDSARRIGMVDTPQGVRFARTPGDLGSSEPLPRPQKSLPSKPVVQEGDGELITDYLYLLMEQMETCQFKEEDRTGGRSKIKDNEVGFPGMQCRHCQGKAGFGRYFPATSSALALANSDRNIHNHVQKCRRCPPSIKEQLAQLSKDQVQLKNRRGLRKMFFERVWNRMHNPSA